MKSFISEVLGSYIETVSREEAAILAQLREETSRHPEAQMQITVQQGQLFQLLVKAIGARQTLELGVFTGYSSLAVALALPEDGRITALDASEEYTSVAQRYWEMAGVRNKIDLRMAPAEESLQVLAREGRGSTYDFAFIDADKESYWIYFDGCVKLVRAGGLIAVDNTLQHGRVADRENNEKNTIAVREFNRRVMNDSRVLSVLVPVADGLTLAVKL